MVSALSLAVVAVGAVLVAGFARWVHCDAHETGVGSPRRWTAIAASTPATGLVLYLLVPSIPVPGLLVIVLMGPSVYLLERDDSQYGDAPADPTLLPDSDPDGSDTEE